MMLRGHAKVEGYGVVGSNAVVAPVLASMKKPQCTARLSTGQPPQSPLGFPQSLKRRSLFKWTNKYKIGFVRLANRYWLSTEVTNNLDEKTILVKGKLV